MCCLPSNPVTSLQSCWLSGATLFVQTIPESLGVFLFLFCFVFWVFRESNENVGLYKRRGIPYESDLSFSSATEGLTQVSFQKNRGSFHLVNRQKHCFWFTPSSGLFFNHSVNRSHFQYSAFNLDDKRAHNTVAGNQICQQTNDEN